MKRKYLNCLSVILSVMIMLSALTITSSAATDGYFTYEIDNGEATITKVKSSIKGSVTIPSSLGGYPVTKIGDKAFYECVDVEAISVPDTIKYIGEHAFYGCENIKKVYINDLAAWLNIDYYVRFFAGYSRRAVGPLYYGADLYVNDVLVEELVIPEGTKEIKDMVFQGCKSITNVVLPNGIELIGSYAFADCENLKEINIPDSIIDFGTSAFSGTKIKKVVINNMDAWFEMFFSTGHGENFPCGSNPLSGGGELYLNDQLVEEIVFPSDIEYIQDCNFEGCTSIKAVYIPESVYRIGIGAFANCKNIEKFYYEGSEEQWVLLTNEWDYNYYFESSDHDWYFKVPIQYNSKMPVKFLNSDTAKIDGNNIVMIPGISVSELLVQAGNGAVVKDSNGNVLASDKCPGTGMILTMEDNKSYNIIVIGDVDDDAVVSSADARFALRASVGLDKYDEKSPYYKAADIDKNGIVSSADARMILRAAVGLENVINWMK